MFPPIFFFTVEPLNSLQMAEIKELKKNAYEKEVVILKIRILVSYLFFSQRYSYKV